MRYPLPENEILVHLNKLADADGVVRAKDVRTCEALGDIYVGYLMKTFPNVGRGLYKVRSAPVAEPVSEQVVIEDDENEPVMEMATGGDLSLIPKVDPFYVNHGSFGLISKIVKSGSFHPVMIFGESGTGKTLAAEQACAKYKRKCVIAAITNETAEEDLIGAFTLVDGNMVWRPGPVLVAMAEGAVLVLDELDQAHPRATMTLQAIMQNKSYLIKKTGQIVEAQPGFTIIGTANTRGDGYGADTFVGAQVLNAAFLDRFPITFEQDYPTPATEKKILAFHSQDAEFVERLVKFGQMSRKAKNEGIITNHITTRKLVHICKNRDIIKSEKESIRYAIARFQPDEISTLIETYEKLLTDKAAGEFNNGASY